MKEMQFDFVNYTFSAVISLVAAIIGVAYPLMMTVVHRFQDFYHTDDVIDWFMTENVYKQFMRLLKLSIPISVLTPFMLYLSGSFFPLSLALLTLQIAFTATLLFKVISLYVLALNYSSCLKLVEITDEEDVKKLVTLMLVADQNRNQEAYGMARDKIYENIVAYLSVCAQKKPKEPLQFQGELRWVVEKILSSSSEMEKYPQISKEITLVGYMYDALYFKLPISEEIYHLQWRTLNEMVRNRNTYWLQAYWEEALQYASKMRMEYNRREELNKFKQFHLFYGSLLLGAGFDDMLHYILTYRGTYPNSSLLLPSTEKEIIEELLKVEELLSTPFVLASNFPMYFLPLDVISDERIYSTYMDYMVFSLLLLPLNHSPYGNGEFSLDGKEKKEEIADVRRIVLLFSKRYTGNVSAYKKFVPKGCFGTLSKKGKAIIEGIISECDTKLQEIEDNDDVDPEKLNDLKSKLIKTYEKSQFPFRKDCCKDDWDTVESTLYVQATVPPGHIMKYHQGRSLNFEETIISAMRHQTSANMARLFLFNKPVATFLIQYRDLLKALDQLQVNDAYVMLSNGVNLWNYGIGSNSELKIEADENGMRFRGMEILPIGSGNHELFILNRKDLPYFTVNSSEPKNGFSLLDGENKLYWIEPTKENKLSMTLCQPILFHQPHVFRFIKFTVSYDTAKGEYNLKGVRDIRKYMGSE